MAESPQLPPRPAPPRRPAEVVATWLAWFGVGRLIAAACSTTIVALGAWWLLSAPPPPSEAALPFATAAGSVAPASTLPPPERSPGSAGEPEVLVVHVVGAVRLPGVYRLEPAARAHDALAAAGGATARADLAGLNLAAPLADGARVYVPEFGEVDPAAVGSAGHGTPDAVAAGPIDVNRATAEQLDALPGVGPATAAAIVAERERNGPFGSVDDLERVPGIGPAKLAALRDLVTV